MHTKNSKTERMLRRTRIEAIREREGSVIRPEEEEPEPFCEFTGPMECNPTGFRREERKESP